MFRALEGVPAWLVGGAVRDELLSRPTDDVDIAVDGDVPALAQALRRETGGAAFPLGEGFGGWRVMTATGHVDLLPLTGGTIETDLAARDLTVNAMARSLVDGTLLDPHGGAPDLEARRLRAVSATSFADDPLRVLRLVRLEAELGFSTEPSTDAAAAESAAALEAVAPERVFAELTRIVLAGSEAVRRMEAVGAAAVVLPELVALQGVEQSVYHHADVHDHTLDVLDAVAQLEADGFVPEADALLHQPLANDLTRWQAMRFAALLHDIAKPETTGTRGDGRGASFVGHDRAGAGVARGVLRRLRASEKLVDYVAALTLHHLRLGFLVHQPLDRRAVHRYLTVTRPWSLDITVFTCADRLATRGRNAERAIAAHLALARAMAADALVERPPPLIRGDELARELGIDPGPRLGELLERLEEDRFAGDIATREDAVERARHHLRG